MVIPADHSFRKSDEYIQMGITSWRNECALPSSRGVYTRISAVKDWIDEQVCAMSSSPPSGCPEKEGVAILVEVTYDNFPYETGWSINQDGRVIESRAEGTMVQPGIVSERVFLDPGEYTFTITDAEGDGICCGYGPGTINYMPNSKVRRTMYSWPREVVSSVPNKQRIYSSRTRNAVAVL